MTVHLIRHGKTYGNSLRRYIGKTDDPLCEDGIALAKQMPANLSVRQVYVTPLLRTQQTASILFPNAAQSIVSDLREMDFGDFENRSADDMRKDSAYHAWVDGNCLGRCPNGESMAEFHDRVCHAFSSVMAGEGQSKDDLYFVLHGGTIMAIMARYGRPTKAFYDYWIDNCKGYQCEVTAADESEPFTLTFQQG